uniref:Uncharacterized protein n=1 Tax=Moniliophthora roreri TaxID=221103 RepID=A0A0W0EWI8_MONRR
MSPPDVPRKSVLPMLVSERLSIGQITFILRAAIQILTCDGLFLITYIILANSPRVASFRTHDTVEALRGKNTDPIPEAPAYGHFAVAFTRNLLQYQQAIIHHFEKFCNNCHNQRFHGQWNTTAVKAYRYDYAEESTFAGPTFFSGLNMTDSDILIPRQLRQYTYKRS